MLSLANFETVYHINGQHVVSINGDKTEDTLYCQVSLIISGKWKKNKQCFGGFL